MKCDLKLSYRLLEFILSNVCKPVFMFDIDVVCSHLIGASELIDLNRSRVTTGIFVKMPCTILIATINTHHPI